MKNRTIIILITIILILFITITTYALKKGQKVTNRKGKHVENTIKDTSLCADKIFCNK